MRLILKAGLAMAASESSPRPIVVVTEGGPHIWAIVNALADRIGPVSVILESPESKKRLLVGRARRQGWVSAIGQLGTMVVTRFGKRFLAGAVRLPGRRSADGPILLLWPPHAT